MADTIKDVAKDITQSWQSGFSTRLYITQEPQNIESAIIDATNSMKDAGGPDVQLIQWNRFGGFYPAGPAPLTPPPKPLKYNTIELGWPLMIMSQDEIERLKNTWPEAAAGDTLPFDPAQPIIFLIHEADAVIGGERRGNGPIVTQIRSYVNNGMNAATYEYDDHGDVINNSDGTPLAVRGKRMIVFVSSGRAISEFMPELRPAHVALPDRDTLSVAVSNVFIPLDNMHKVDAKRGIAMPDKAILDGITTSVIGMTYQDAEDSISRAWNQVGSVENMDDFLEVIETEKARILNGVAGLSYMPKSQIPTHDLPGYEKVTAILRDYLEVPADAAVTHKIPRLKGFLLVGSPGCGKTELAKTVSRTTKRFPMTLNLGEIQGGIVGQSERQMREALDVIRAIEPVVLVDEIDKMGTSAAESGHTGDGGTFSRIIGMLLTEMTDPNNKAIFILTANNLVNDRGGSLIPSSMLRAGRIDERFFVDAPCPIIRRSIFHVRAGIHGMEFDSASRLDTLIEMTDKWVGAEIANVVQRGVRRALATGKGKIDTASMIEYATSFTPTLKQPAFTEQFERQREACKEFTIVGKSDTPTEVYKPKPTPTRRGRALN